MRRHRSSQFRKEEAPFVETFVTDLSKRWDIADVHDRMATAFIEQAGTPQAQQLLLRFKELGVLKSTHDLELRNYYEGTTGRTGPDAILMHLLILGVVDYLAAVPRAPQGWRSATTDCVEACLDWWADGACGGGGKSEKATDCGCQGARPTQGAGADR